MSDIVIRGIEMPKDKQYSLTIFPNGKVIQHWDGVVFGETKAIELPQHGRLGDLDKLYEVATAPYGNFYGFQALIKDIKNAPTILEASKE